MNREISLLQLLEYFIVRQNYTQVQFLNNKEPQDDKWLINPERKFMIIHLTADSFKINTDNQYKIRSQANSLKNVIRKQGMTLDICLDSEPNDFISGDIVTVAIGENVPINSEILLEFPDLDKVLHSVDNPTDEAIRVTQSVNYSLKSRHKAEGKQKNEILKSEFKKALSKTFITCAVICAVIWIGITLIMHLWKFDEVPVSIVFGAYYKGFINYFNEWYRLLTSGFVHASFWHLFCNLWALFNVSRMVEDQFGYLKTMGILVISVIFANLCVYASQPNIVAVGLSGGICGLFGAYLVICWQKGLFKYPAFRRNIMSNLYINVLISLLPNVSWVAHVAGLVIGAFLALIMSAQTEKLLRTNCIICLTALLVIVGYMGYNNRKLDVIYGGTDVQVAQIFEKMGLDEIGARIRKGSAEYRN
ncbi:MAG: rhomboid family intramembrane serine protease [Erysipelotrichaceae bacterium]|nr:rhomboid family intramembrane serine protease [Erysipelotrichaceae bacterium]